MKAEFGEMMKVGTVDPMKYELQESQLATVKFYMQCRFKSSARLREPRFAVVGPPGSGRETYSKMICNRYGLIHVSVRELTHTEIIANTAEGRVIKDCLDNGELIPD